MFTGIVQGLGEVTDVDKDDKTGSVCLEVRAAFPLRGISIGDSIAVNGVCLTVVARNGRTFEADLGPETLARTTLGRLSAGNRVHLERALKVGDELGGHLVTGHVDGKGRVVSVKRDGAARTLTVMVPPVLQSQLVPKGSVAMDGVSLTVNQVDGARFRVTLIPHTLAVTRLGQLAIADEVNIETDLIAKHVQRLVQLPGTRERRKKSTPKPGRKTNRKTNRSKK